jgi:hypothetical protein
VRHAPPDVYAKNLRELVTQMKATGGEIDFRHDDAGAEWR